LRPNKLRCSAKRIPILSQVVLIFLETNLLCMELDKFAAFQKMPDIVGGFYLDDTLKSLFKDWKTS
jgi:hypothetical protein